MRKILTSILMLSFLLTIQSTAQNWQWAQSAGGLDVDFGSSVSTDANGNVYVTGTFTSPVITFGSTTLTNAGYANIFIVKYNSSGNVLWAKQAGGTNDDRGISFADANGNLYITGRFSSPAITFGAVTLNNLNPGLFDIFTVKYDSSGNALWAKGAGGSANDEGKSVVSDGSGNVYITGAFSSSTINFGSITLLNANTDTLNIFVSKYDSSGNVIWAKNIGGTDNDIGGSITTDVNSNVFVTGYFQSTSINFGGIVLTNANPPFQDVFVTKYDSSGNVLWAKSAGGNSSDSPSSIIIDINGNAYLTGSFQSPTITFGSTTLTNAGGYDIFVTKYDSSGSIVWANSSGNIANDFSSSISCDNSGSIFVTGSFQSSTISFGSTTLTNAGSSDIFIVKYDISGNALWAESLGGLTLDGISRISATSNGNLFLTGGFQSVTMALGSITLTNANNAGSTYDMFVGKLDYVTGINESSNFINENIFPNPVSKSTIISFSLSQAERVSVKIFDMTGRLVKTLANAEMNEGNHQLEWNATDEKGNAVGAGIYFLKVDARDFSETKKLSVMK